MNGRWGGRDNERTEGMSVRARERAWWFIGNGGGLREVLLKIEDLEMCKH